jgi:hypothetical protein
MARLKFENRGALAGGLRPLPCLYIKPTTNKEDFKAIPTLSCHFLLSYEETSALIATNPCFFLLRLIPACLQVFAPVP